MSSRPFRFVHAADLHLERPPWGIAEVPDHLRELFIESPYWAAERVVETALAEEADFLVLAGDVIDAQLAGPRGPLFLVEQFERLGERGIAVYWAGGRVDPPDAWPSAIHLPDNVHVFPRGQVEEFVHERGGVQVARLMGRSRGRRDRIRTGDFHPDEGGLLSIAVAYGVIDEAAAQSRGLDYWALGGRHARATLANAPHAIHYPGTPQGRQIEEPGAHGCTVVEVDQQRRLRPLLVPTDVMRWHAERITVEEATTRDDLQKRLGERMRALIEAAPGTDLLVCWTIAGRGPLIGQLRRGGLAAELLGWLRSHFGFGPPAAWSVLLEAELSEATPPEWYEQDTIRGEFLRAVRRHELDPDEPLDLTRLLSESQLAGTLAEAADLSDESTRRRVLREAAALGIDLLTGEETPP